MAQGYDANRESEQARRRLTELAREIGRRSTTGYVKHEAEALFHEKKEEVQALVSEKKAEAKDRAREKSREWVAHKKETTVAKTIEYKDRALGSSTFLGIIGALIGAAVGRSVAKWNEEDTDVRTFGRDRGFPDYDLQNRNFETQNYSAKNYSRTDYGAPGASYGDRGYGAVQTNLDADIGVAPVNTYATTANIPAPVYGTDYGTSVGSVGTVGTVGDIGPSTTFDASADNGPGIKEKVADKFAGAKDKLSGATHSAKDRLSGAKESFSAKAGNVAESARGKLDMAKERLHGTFDHVKERTGDAYTHIPSRDRVAGMYHQRVEEQPWILAAGALGLGFLASLFIPESEKERQLLQPLRSNLDDRVRDYKTKAQGFVQDKLHQVEEKISPSEEQPADTSIQASGSFEATSMGSSIDTTVSPTMGGTGMGGTNLAGTGVGGSYTSMGRTFGDRDRPVDIASDDGLVAGSLESEWPIDTPASEIAVTPIAPTDAMSADSTADLNADAAIDSDIDDDNRRDDRGAIAGTYDPPTVH